MHKIALSCFHFNCNRPFGTCLPEGWRVPRTVTRWCVRDAAIRFSISTCSDFSSAGSRATKCTKYSNVYCTHWKHIDCPCVNVIDNARTYVRTSSNFLRHTCGLAPSTTTWLSSSLLSTGLRKCSSHSNNRAASRRASGSTSIRTHEDCRWLSSIRNWRTCFRSASSVSW